MDFDSLLKIVEEKNQINGEKCLICHFPDKAENLTKLSCSHYFHLSCLNVNFQKNKKSKKIICPYCNTKATVKNNNIINEEKLECCKVILKSGINKGKECGRISCKYHK